MINTVIKDYVLTRKLGEGGMATVYEAKNALGIKFALKVLKSELIDNNSIRAWFKQEACILAKLNKIPHICGAHECIEGDDGSLAIVMEYLEGMDLNSYIKAKGSLSPALARKFCDQIIPSLDAAHNEGIIHRDIKPSNLFYTTKGDFRILDFGISKICFGNDEEATIRQTTTFRATGTLAYMSPEQIQCKKDIDKRTDIYSFGLTLYYLLTGDDPSNMEEESLQIISDEGLINLIKATTRKDRNKRVSSCKELLTSLKQTNATRNTYLPPQHSYIPSKPTLNNQQNIAQNNSTSSNAHSSSSKHPSPILLWAVALAIVVMAGGGGGFWYANLQDKQRAADREIAHKREELAHQRELERLRQEQAASERKEAREREEREKQARIAQKEREERQEREAEKRREASRREAAKLEEENSATALFEKALRARSYDKKSAFNLLLQAAQKGHAQAQALVSFCYIYGEGTTIDNDEAYKWARKSALQGNALGQNYLGVCYNNGKGIYKDNDEAVRWYRKAVAQNNARAQNNLGSCYQHSMGVRYNIYEAFRLYSLSANQGDPAGQRNLGKCYLEGKGVSKSVSEGIRWLRMAEQQGDKPAKKILQRYK